MPQIASQTLPRTLQAVLLSLSLLGAWAVPAQAETGAEMKPAVSINYTQRNISVDHIIKTLVTEVNKVDPQATYDVVGYETTPKNTYYPVSKRVKTVQDILAKYGVSPDKIYVLIKPTETPYQQIDVFVHN